MWFDAVIMAILRDFIFSIVLFFSFSLLLFVDEADAFLRKRNQVRMFLVIEKTAHHQVN